MHHTRMLTFAWWFMSAPLMRSSSTIWSWPFLLAVYNAVWPSCTCKGEQDRTRSTEPQENNTSHHLTWWNLMMTKCAAHTFLWEITFHYVHLHTVILEINTAILMCSQDHAYHENTVSLEINVVTLSMSTLKVIMHNLTIGRGWYLTQPLETYWLPLGKGNKGLVVLQEPLPQSGREHRALITASCSQYSQIQQNSQMQQIQPNTAIVMLVTVTANAAQYIAVVTLVTSEVQMHTLK